MGTLFDMYTEVAIDTASITITDPLDWSVLPVSLEKRISNSFDDYSVPFYEFPFTRIKLQLPFSDFEVAILTHLKVSPS